MKSAPVLLTLTALWAAGCAQTGDPRAGGLFGWSESLAQDRLSERRAAIADADRELKQEQRGTAASSRRKDQLAREEANAASQRDQAAATLRNREAAVRQKARQLESESPTPASASRARRLRTATETVIADRGLSETARAQELRRLELEIDEARAQLAR